METVIQITDYTTGQKASNAIGITNNEITASMISGQDLDITLLADLNEWLPDHATIWATYQGTPTAEEELKGMYLQLYSQWFVATRLAEMWLAMPQRISDGKEDMRRFAELDLEELVAMAKARRDGYRNKLLLLEDPDSVTTLSLMSSASPSRDPVTNIST